MAETRAQLFLQQAAAVGFDADDEIRIGGNYQALVRDGNLLYVSGQVPRIGSEVVVKGAVGGEIDLAAAQHGARIAVLRCLALLQRELGSLEQIARMLTMTVYVRSAAGFAQQSEVADAASELLLQVMGDAGRHARTSVGVAELPKGAAVEIALQARANS
ncbi:RidA family protein [Aquitalea aquatilis]|uniref:RidA family protein n=1 Tax=Aquitalea aquatilis TaxID=1537400 RepID=UPI0010BD8CDB|nr:RidA family protein [Aquitalea aquatilis]